MKVELNIAHIWYGGPTSELFFLILKDMLWVLKKCGTDMILSSIYIDRIYAFTYFLDDTNFTKSALFDLNY